MRVLLGLLPVLLALLCGGAGSAHAHAVLLESTPADGAVLAAEPAALMLRFSEPVRPLAVRVLDAAGAVISDGEEVMAHDAMLHLPLGQTFRNGSYLVTYRVTSLDAHPVGGSIVFAVGEPLTDISAEVGESGRWWAPVLLMRFLTYVGLAVGAGGALFLLLVVGPHTAPPPSLHRLVTAGAALGAGAALLSIGIHGAHLLDSPYRDVLATALWTDAAASAFGAGALITSGGLALVACAPRFQGWMRRPLLGLGALAAVAGLPLAGHVTTAGAWWLTAPVLVAHGLCVALWIGSLGGLVIQVARDGRDAGLMLERFSRIAVPAVIVLLASGTLMAILQVRDPETLLTTTYGRILLLKLAVVTLLLLLAAINKWRLTPAIRAGAARAAHRFRQTVGLEAAGAALILAATASLGLTPPPRALAELDPSGPGYVTETSAAGRRVLIEVAPARPGPNDVRLTLTTPGGEPVQPLELHVAVGQPAAGIEPLQREAEPDGQAYRIAGLVLPVSGVWRVQVEALVSDFERIATAVDIHIH
ncbi:MAG TPA: CopD family protein [Geminicoccaceae bacterium]